jgi:hypothetical protein
MTELQLNKVHQTPAELSVFHFINSIKSRTLFCKGEPMVDGARALESTLRCTFVRCYRVFVAAVLVRETPANG